MGAGIKYLGPIHTYPFSFQNAISSLQIRLPEWNFLKTLFSRVRVDRRKRNFSKTLITHYQFQSTPRNIRNLFKMADGRLPFLVFYTWACFQPIACFQANLALLNLQADNSRRQQNIIKPVTFTTGVKRRKVGYPFSLTLFLP